MLLTVEHLCKRFDGLAAVSDVSFSVGNGEILAVIGPNGAGKTTLVNVLTKVLPATEGRITFDGADITDLEANVIARAGLARTFQNLRLFPSLTVFENVVAGRVGHLRATLLDAMLARRGRAGGIRAALTHAARILDMLGLTEDADRPARDLPYGRRRLVEVGRALCGGPKLLCLDEPTSGLSQDEATRLGQLIRQLRADGISLLLIEHNVPLVMEIADRVLVLNHGEQIALDTPASVMRDERVIQAYLGVQD